MLRDRYEVEDTRLPRKPVVDDAEVRKGVEPLNSRHRQHQLGPARTDNLRPNCGFSPEPWSARLNIPYETSVLLLSTSGWI
jgi:hypothetical protein